MVVLGGLRLRGDGEIGEVAFRTLGVRSYQIGILGVQKREGLRTGSIRIHTHFSNCESELLVLSLSNKSLVGRLKMFQ